MPNKPSFNPIQPNSKEIKIKDSFVNTNDASFFLTHVPKIIETKSQLVGYAFTGTEQTRTNFNLNFNLNLNKTKTKTKTKTKKNKKEDPLDLDPLSTYLSTNPDFLRNQASFTNLKTWKAPLPKHIQPSLNFLRLALHNPVFYWRWLKESSPPHYSYPTKATLVKFEKKKPWSSTSLTWNSPSFRSYTNEEGSSFSLMNTTDSSISSLDTTSNLSITSSDEDENVDYKERDEKQVTTKNKGFKLKHRTKPLYPSASSSIYDMTLEDLKQTSKFKSTSMVNDKEMRSIQSSNVITKKPFLKVTHGHYEFMKQTHKRKGNQFNLKEKKNNSKPRLKGKGKGKETNPRKSKENSNDHDLTEENEENEDGLYFERELLKKLFYKLRLLQENLTRTSVLDSQLQQHHSKSNQSKKEVPFSQSQLEQ